MQEGTCRTCGQTKPLEQFLRDAECVTGYRNKCKACVNAQARAKWAARWETDQAWREEQQARQRGKDARKRLANMRSCDCGTAIPARQTHCDTCAAPLKRTAAIKALGRRMTSVARALRASAVCEKCGDSFSRDPQYKATLCRDCRRKPRCNDGTCGDCPTCSKRGQRQRYRATPNAKERRRQQRAVRRARERNAPKVEPIYRRKVFERDGWRCHLCGHKVNASAVVPHPKAPTLDHVIPLAEGGEHTYANVRCAHFICNSRKGSTATGEQLLLVG